MKTIYTILLLVSVIFTSSAQTVPTYVLPFHEDFTYDDIYNIGIDLSGNGWEIVTAVNPKNSKSNPAYSPVPTGATTNLGHYLSNRNGNGTRIISTRVTVPLTNNKITLTWWERTTDVGIISRNISYKSSEATTYSKHEESRLQDLNWTKHTAIIHTDGISGQNIDLLWEVVRIEGNSSGYDIDDIVVFGEYEPIPVAVLPVELASFSGQTLVGAIKLDWTTASEKHNDKFIVERSQDGKHFAKAGEVKGSGNSAIKRSYSFTDNVPFGGINYYRLRQIDFDGTESFSKVVALQVAGGTAGLTATVYPTVAFSSVTISLQHVSNVVISVSDASGRVMATFNNITEREITLPVNNFKSGLYFVRVTDGQNHKVQRFIKE